MFTLLVMGFTLALLNIRGEIEFNGNYIAIPVIADLFMLCKLFGWL